MGTSMTRSTEAAYPDRGGWGLGLSFDVGHDGAYVRHELGVDAAVLHVRLMMATKSASGGSVRLAGGHDAAGAETWWLDFDADARTVTVELASGETVSAGLSGLTWHCVEWLVDVAGGVLWLWVDGVMREMTVGVFAGLASRSVWLGGVLKDTALTGELYLDEWVVDEQYIGPVTVRPMGEHADDPRRWLVVYNSSGSDGETWAEAYRQARKVPYANLLGLSLPTSETINWEQYAQLAVSVNAYLVNNGLAEQVMGVLLGFGVPGYVTDDGGRWMRCRR